jgi:dTDP-4-amino-4,6-dideoxygalactose transaminase
VNRVTVGDFRIGEKERQAVLDVLDSGRISEGARVREFERKWAEFNGTKYCVATSSGFGALVVGWQAIKYRRGLAGGKVVTSPLTYVADASALITVGLEPVFVDIDPVTFGITPEAVEAVLAMAAPGEYVGLMPVDLMGFVTDMDAMREIADRYGLALIEDAAQAHGSLYHGRRAGSMGDAGVFSFYIAHNVQAGEMGAIVTDDLDLYKLSRRLKAQGRACDCLVCTRSQGICPQMRNAEPGSDFDPRFSHDLIGFNFKTMEFQAALGLGQIEGVDEIMRVRYENVRYLAEGLADLGAHLQLPPIDSSVSYLAFPVVVRPGSPLDRGALRAHLESEGVETRPLFGSIPTQQPAFARLREIYAGKLPNADYAGSHGMYVGCHQYLERADLDQIVDAFHSAFAGA